MTNDYGQHKCAVTCTTCTISRTVATGGPKPEQFTGASWHGRHRLEISIQEIGVTEAQQDDARKQSDVATKVEVLGGTMPIERVREAADYYSSTASTVTRQLALAGIGVVWIVRIGGEDAGGVRWDDGLLWPLFLFVFALLLDLLHYVHATYRWDKFHDECEQDKHGKHDAISAPPSINSPNKRYFYLKVALCSLGFSLLLFHIGSNLYVEGAGRTPQVNAGPQAKPDPPK
ncbi:hypothetical protein H6G33_37955 [Calothrix sp. FACHB-1219]|uniref:hypothetical protein n=1 Tax=Calothrix sp. FACHB-1219 TaxID=2692778 RepID=UPI0016828A30|nr:hypothetical protein [Calothrix sp. FACHB-1219]